MMMRFKIKKKDLYVLLYHIEYAADNFECNKLINSIQKEINKKQSNGYQIHF